VGLLYCLKTLSSTVQCIGLFLLVEDDVHHGFFFSKESEAASKIKEEKLVRSSYVRIVLEHFVPVIF
jgi:hypothetical protein